MLIQHVPPPSAYKISCSLLVDWQCGEGGRVSLWTGVHNHPHPAASKLKQTFLSTNFASLMAFKQRVARPHFRYKTTDRSTAEPSVGRQVCQADFELLPNWTLRNSLHPPKLYIIFFFFLAMSCGSQDLSSPTKDGTRVTAVKAK